MNDNERGKTARETAENAAIREVFAHWQQRCGHAKAELTAKRRMKIRNRLREKAFTVGALKEAIDGAAVGAVVSGGKRYDDIELICRDAEHVESFIGRTGPPGSDGRNGASGNGVLALAPGVREEVIDTGFHEAAPAVEGYGNGFVAPNPARALPFAEVFP